MGKKYRRNCDQCGELYEGYGPNYCSISCSNYARRNSDSGQVLPEAGMPKKVSKEIHFVEHGDEATLYIEASHTIKTPEQLVERAGVDLKKWEITDSKVRTWSVPMKVDDQPTVLQMYYVSVSLKKPITERLPVRSLVIQTTPHEPRPPKQSGLLTSVHYSDCHFPYQDDRALEILYQILHELQPEIVVDHGDLLDCEQIGRFAKDPYNRTSLAEEIKLAARHIAKVHSITPNARHIWLEGNHEERLKRTIWALADQRTAGEVLTLPGMAEVLSWGNMLGLNGIGWEVVPYPSTLTLFDRLILAHGSRVRQHSAYSAKSEHDQYGKSGMSGHTHRMGAYYHTDYNGPHVWIELGLMGKIRNDYVSHANWQQGFAVVTWSEDRKRFGVEHVNIHDGSALFRGKWYHGV